MHKQQTAKCHKLTLTQQHQQQQRWHQRQQQQQWWHQWQLQQQQHRQKQKQQKNKSAKMFNKSKICQEDVETFLFNK